MDESDCLGEVFRARVVISATRADDLHHRVGRARSAMENSVAVSATPARGMGDAHLSVQKTRPCGQLLPTVARLR
eukprot:scaffold47965_cov242-Isochrysis_galbana.AAC.2